MERVALEPLVMHREVVLPGDGDEIEGSGGVGLQPAFCFRASFEGWRLGRYSLRYEFFDVGLDDVVAVDAASVVFARRPGQVVLIPDEDVRRAGGLRESIQPGIRLGTRRKISDSERSVFEAVVDVVLASLELSGVGDEVDLVDEGARGLLLGRLIERLQQKRHDPSRGRIRACLDGGTHLGA